MKKDVISVLVVDDHKIVRDGIRSILKADKQIVVLDEATNGTEAIEKIEKYEGKIDVVILDISMPELNGIDATEIIIKLYPEMRILGLSMHSDEAYVLNMIKAGALGYVLKDAGGQKLIEAVKTISEGNKYYSNEVSVTLINSMLKPKKHREIAFGLSKREREILQHVAKGKTNTQISDSLALSRRTVESHRRNIMKKMKVKNAVDMVSTALRSGIVD